METPFISVSYEQKMKGFMEKVKLDNYCIDVLELKLEDLIEKFQNLENEYQNYKKYLKDISKKIRKESSKTSEYLFKHLENLK